MNISETRSSVDLSPNAVLSTSMQSMIQICIDHYVFVADVHLESAELCQAEGATETAAQHLHFARHASAMLHYLRWLLTGDESQKVH